MRLSYTPKTLFGALAVVAIGASLAGAQDTTKAKPKSQRRIPIAKEQAGEVARTDTVTVYRTDTMRVTTQLPGRVDTVRTTNTVYRVDTLTVAPPVRPVRLPGGLYFGLGGGVFTPNGALFNTNSAGPGAQAQIGWQGLNSLLGVRGDVNWAKPGEDSRWAGFQADPDILNFSADARLNIPFLSHMFGVTHRFGIYGIGGYTHTMYKNLPMRVNFDAAGADCVTQPGICAVHGNGDWTHMNGWNAGGGASLGWGRTELFLESRVLAFSPANAPQSRQIPFVFGMNWY